MSGLVILPLLIVPNGSHAADVLEELPGLSRQLALSEAMISVSGLLEHVAAVSGVPIEAEASLGKITVFVYTRDRPARELVQQLAQLLHGTWARDRAGKGLRLARSAGAKALLYRKQLAYRISCATELAQQVTLGAELAPELLPLDPSAQRAQARETREAAEALPVGKERFELEVRSSVMGDLVDPVPRLGYLAWTGISERQRHELLLGRRLTIAASRPADVVMTPSLQSACREARSWAARRAARDLPVVESRTADEVLVLRGQLAAGHLVVGSILRRLPETPAAPRSVLPRLLMSPSREAAGRSATREPPGTLTADTPSDLRSLVRLSWADKRLAPTDALTYTPLVLPSEVPASLAIETPGFAFLGHSFWRPVRSLLPDESQGQGIRSAAQALAALRNRSLQSGVQLSEVLRELTVRAPMNVTVTRGKWVRCESTTAFEHEAGCVEPDLVQKAFQPCAEAGGFTLADGIAVGSLLTSAQAQVLADDQLSFLRQEIPNASLSVRYPVWSFLSRLGPAVAGQLWREGGTVKYGSANERAAILDLIRQLPICDPNCILDQELSPQDYPKLSVTVLRTPSDSERRIQVTLPGVAYPLYDATVRVGVRRIQAQPGSNKG